MKLATVVLALVHLGLLFFNHPRMISNNERIGLTYPETFFGKQSIQTILEHQALSIEAFSYIYSNEVIWCGQLIGPKAVPTQHYLDTQLHMILVKA